MKIRINRAPVLTLWAAVVAEELGYSLKEALTLGKAIAGKGAVNKAKAIGLMKETDAEEREERARARDEASDGAVFFMGKSVRVIKAKDGLAAEENGKPTSHESVDKYLTKKFGESLAPLRAAMVKLAHSREKKVLEREAFRLYEQFRPEIPKGAQGWGKAGELDTAVIEELGSSQSKRGKAFR